MKQRIGFGILGAGTAARNHAAAIAGRNDAELIGVASASLESAEQLVAESGHGRAMRKEDLFGERSIDVIAICTPNALHCPQILEAARAGKHVLVEKPIGISTAAANDAVRECRARGVILGVVHPRRFDPTWISLERLAYGGTLGRLLWLDASVFFYRDSSYYASSWRGRLAIEGGPHLTQGIHHVDIVRSLITAAESRFGGDGTISESHTISASLSHRLEVPDSLCTVFQTSTGALGTFRVSTALRGMAGSSVQLHFEHGQIRVEDDLIVFAHGADGGPLSGLQSDTWGWGAQAMKPVLADMCEAVDQGRDPLMTGEEAARSLAYCLRLFGSPAE
jgi:UDP-N-acetyl-2-amino-2-deoxyglucuronate dehydrogenase